MDPNPYSEELAQASEYLRLALTLLTKHRIPPSPLNYRIGYDYAAGASENLRKGFDALVRENKASSQQHLWELYQRNYIQDEKALDAMRQELRRIINDVQGEFEDSGNSLSRYAGTLKRFAGLLETSEPQATMTTEVDKVIRETRDVEQSQNQLSEQLSGIVAEVQELRKELEQVREESLTDALTGISNRKAFDAALEEATHIAREQQTSFCILLVDIDHFKQFNDTYGHLVGDKVLRFVASTLKRCIKGKDIAARFGGEEFVVILPDTTMEGADAVAEQIRQTVSAGRLKDKASEESYGRITISIGVAEFCESDLPNELLQRADQALYRAKDLGRNRVEKAA